jgi:sec-independent protein translocase protein TatA
MFGSLGVPEMLFIMVLALLIFGPKKLPEIGRTLGRGMAEFRKASNELRRSINTELALDETPSPPMAQIPRRFESLAGEPAAAEPLPIEPRPALAAVPRVEPAAATPEAQDAAAPPPQPDPLEPH